MFPSFPVEDCSSPLQIDRFQYLGLMLASDFTWSGHVAFVAGAKRGGGEGEKRENGEKGRER